MILFIIIDLSLVQNGLVKCRVLFHTKQQKIVVVTATAAFLSFFSSSSSTNPPVSKRRNPKETGNEYACCKHKMSDG